MEREIRPLSDRERLDWLRLARSETIGARTFFALLAHFGGVADALAGATELSRRGGRKRPIRLADEGDVAREIDTGDAVGARLVAWCEPEYPEPLAAIDDPPPVLWVRGTVDTLNQRAVGVVGARNASAAGRRLAREIATGLGAAGFAVVSGLARGIDTAAHQAALDTGTVAALAGGVDIVYPPENGALYNAIVERGAVISEHPPGVTPTGRHFPPRNRLISGLTLGVLVVEAAHRSGSLITARMALEQGREVFAVPGSPLDPRCRGTNGLLRQGAVLTEDADDIISAVGGMVRRTPPARENPEIFAQSDDFPDESGLSEARDRMLELLGGTPVTVDELVRECQLSAAVAMTVLLELELAGRVERHPGHRVSLAL